MSENLISLRKRAADLIEANGGLSNAARALEIDKAYLHRLYSGEKVNPGPLILEKLGLSEKKVMYVLK